MYNILMIPQIDVSNVLINLDLQVLREYIIKVFFKKRTRLFVDLNRNRIFPMVRFGHHRIRDPDQ